MKIDTYGIVVVVLAVGLVAVLVLILTGHGDKRDRCERAGGVWLSRDAVCIRRDLTIDVRK